MSETTPSECTASQVAIVGLIVFAALGVFCVRNRSAVIATGYADQIVVSTIIIGEVLLLYFLRQLSVARRQQRAWIVVIAILTILSTAGTLILLYA